MVDIPPAAHERAYPQGVRSFWYGDTGIAGFAPTGSLSPLTISESQQALTDLIAQMPDPNNAYIVFHFQKLTSFSPRLRHTSEEVIASLQPGQTLHAAIVLKDNLITSLLSAFTLILRRQANGRFNYQLFKDEASAFAWLQAQQAKSPASAS